MKTFILAGEQDNTECLKRLPNLEKEFFSQTFQISKPLTKPGYFSVNNFADINRIGVLVKQSIIILRIENDKIYLLHNFPNKISKRPFLYIAIQAIPKTANFQIHTMDFSLSPDHIAVENNLFSKTIPLQLPISSNNNNNSNENANKTEIELEKIISLDDSLSSTNVVLLMRFNCCLKKNVSFSKLFSPKNCYFSLEHIYYDKQKYSSELEAIKKSQKEKNLKIVFSFLNDSFLGVINNNISEKFEKTIVSNIMGIKNRDKIRRENFANIPLHVSHEEFIKAKEKRNANKKYKPKVFNKICLCKLCSATSFDSNMNASGPEQLCKSKWLLQDLLKLLGFNSPNMLKIVDQLAELSVASFDIESRSVKVDMHNFEKDVKIFFPKPLDSSGAVRGCAVEAIQKPCMLAHTDKLDNKSDTNNNIKIFECQNDSEAEIFDMFTSYWTYLVERQKLITEEKKKIANPIYKIVERLEKEHRDFCELWSNQYGHLPELHMHRTKKSKKIDSNSLKLLFLKDANSSFKTSLFGQLKSELEKMIHQLNVFSFYG